MKYLDLTPPPTTEELAMMWTVRILVGVILLCLLLS